MEMRTKAMPLCLLMILVFGLVANAQDKLRNAKSVNSQGAVNEGPKILGHGVGLFKTGRLLHQDQFANLDNWVVQVQERSGFGPATVEARNNSLDCLVPGRGCTVWFREKLPTRVAITYDILCPTHDPEIQGVRPRDINNFWMSTDPNVAGQVDRDQADQDPLHRDRGLFDAARYTGAFKTYDKMHGYYASTGGGPEANPTTRMRRYPREIDGEPADHVALTAKDGKPAYLIAPDRVMRVQLVAFDDVIQYIVDGKLVYQMRRGDNIQLETRNDDGQRETQEAVYDLARFPVYSEGYVGFRMVGTHHIYTNFRVFALEKDVDGQPRPTVRVSSLQALREAVANSNQQIILEPGEYRVGSRDGMRFSGSNNDVDLAGVTIKVPLDVASGRSLFWLSGNHITLRGGTLEDVYPDGQTEVSDFGAYNRGKRFGGMNEIVIRGDDNRVIGMKMTVRGSFPYGYGNMFGIGSGSVVDLRKHCGIQIRGNRAVIDGCDIKMEAFGHAIYAQGGDRTTVRNTVVEGTLRPSNDCYSETNKRDLANRFNYELQWPESVKGLPIPRDHMINCTEDGIRAYKGAGDMIVENCVVKKTRGGIKLYMARSAKVSDCQVLDCVVQGYSLPSRGVITNSSGNAAYGPLLYVHSDRHSNQRIDLTVLPSPHGIGDHPLAAIKGRGHSIRFTSAGNSTIETKRPIIVGYPMRFDFLCVDYPDVPAGHEELFAKHAPATYEASGMTIENGTGHPVFLSELSKGNRVSTVGAARDKGTDNKIKSAVGSASDR